MKKSIFVLLLFFSGNLIISAQNYAEKFGKISQAEVDYLECESDKNAEAVVLFDIGRSYFRRTNEGFELLFERTCRIKILKESGLKWAEVEIPIYQEGGIYENVESIKAFSYNYENRNLVKTSVDKKQVFEEKKNEFWVIKKFAIPNVKVGSIIEYKYTISSQYLFNLRDWEFQWRIPVVYSEYKTEMIPFYQYTFLLLGATKFDFQESKVDGMTRHFGSIEFRDYVHKYGMKDVPAFVDEGYVTSPDDYILKMDFQLSKINYPNGVVNEIKTTWPNMIKDLLKNQNFGKYQKKSEKLAAKNPEIVRLDTMSEKERFNEVMDIVKRNFNWNGHYGKYTNTTAATFLKDKIGSVAEINLFAVGALNAAGIEAYPVIISTRDNGRIWIDYPFSHFFNYVIIYAIIDGKGILTDATETLCANNRIPSRCINDKGLLIKEGDVKWLGLQSAIPSIKQKNFVIDLYEKVDTTEVVFKFSEYDALKWRKRIGDDVEKLKDEFTERKYTLLDESTRIENYSKLKKPYEIYSATTNKVERINDKLYISPFLGEVISDNPFKQKKRTYPIDMVYSKIRTFETVINIPESYQVDYFPEISTIRNSLFDLSYKVTELDGKVRVKFNYFFKKPVYSAEDYSKIKYYFEEIVKAGNEKIVLKKVE